jgi:hypothetical protein
MHILKRQKIKWDTADKDKYIELVNEGIQSSDLTLETARDDEKAFNSASARCK